MTIPHKIQSTIPELGEYFVGTQVSMTATFKDAAGTLVDPTDAKFLLMTPAGTETTYTVAINPTIVSRVSTGIYKCIYPKFTLTGRHAVGVRGTAVVLASCEGIVTVKATMFAAAP